MNPNGEGVRIKALQTTEKNYFFPPVGGDLSSLPHSDKDCPIYRVQKMAFSSSFWLKKGQKRLQNRKSEDSECTYPVNMLLLAKIISTMRRK
jgi:hypothetical protein